MTKELDRDRHHVRQNIAYMYLMSVNKHSQFYNIKVKLLGAIKRVMKSPS